MMGSKIDLFKFYDKYGKERRFPNIQGKYSVFCLESPQLSAVYSKCPKISNTLFCTFLA